MLGGGVAVIGDAAFNCLALGDVYYKGTAEDWAEMDISEEYNGDLRAATRYFYSEEAPTEEGDYWRYDENGEIVVW